MQTSKQAKTTTETCNKQNELLSGLEEKEN